MVGKTFRRAMKSPLADDDVQQVSSQKEEDLYSESLDQEAFSQQTEIRTLEDDELPQGRQLGVLSAVFVMANRVVGTGVFSTTSTILAQSGSVGMSLMYVLV